MERWEETIVNTGTGTDGIQPGIASISFSARPSFVPSFGNKPSPAPARLTASVEVEEILFSSTSYRQKASADVIIPLTEHPLSSLQVTAQGTATYPASTDEPVNPVSATPGSSRL
jgi:hypothetical protein